MLNDAPIYILEGPLTQEIADTLASTGWRTRLFSDARHVLHGDTEKIALLILDIQALTLNQSAIHQLEQNIKAPMLFVVPTMKTGYPTRTIEASSEQETILRHVRELLLTTPCEIVRVGKLTIDLQGWWVTLDNQSVYLSTTQFRLLACLARSIGRVVPYGRLLSEVWKCSNDTGNRNMIASCVRRLREKLNESAEDPEYLVAVRGVGYRLRNEVQWKHAIKTR